MNDSAPPPFDDLEALQWLDPDVFLPSSDEETAEAALILSLALVFNDLRDLFWALALLRDSRPGSSATPGRFSGLHSGNTNFVLRHIHSVMFEFTELIRGHRHVLDGEMMRRIRGAMPRRQREIWDAVRSACLQPDKMAGDSLHLLSRIRNNLVYHYGQTKELHRGYRKFFDKSAPHRSHAFASRGRNMKSTRYYFADAAMLGAYGNIMDPAVEKHLIDLMGKIHVAIVGVVNGYVVARRQTWHQWNPIRIRGFPP